MVKSRSAWVGMDRAKSNGGARGVLAQKSYSVNGVQLEEKAQLRKHKLVHGKYLLMRKGKKSHHRVEQVL